MARTRFNRRTTTQPAPGTEGAEPFFGKTKTGPARTAPAPFFQAKPQDGKDSDSAEQKADALTGPAPQSEGPAGPEPAAATPQANGAVPVARFIVEDEATPSPQQMRKTDFLDRLQQELSATLDTALAGTPYALAVGVYIRAALARHRNSTPLQIEQMIQGYAPEALKAPSLDAMLLAVNASVASAAGDWAKGGGDMSALAGTGGAGEAPGKGSLLGGLFLKATSINTGGATPAPAPVMQQLGKGATLDQHSQSKLAPALGGGLGDVEVHTDSKAAGLSNDLDARAFTVGNHIAFGSGEYKPGTVEGDALMAHELAHVRQQQGAGMQGKAVDAQTDTQSLENDADQSAASSVLNAHGKGPGVLERVKKGLGKMKTGLSIQRCSKPAGSNAKTKEEILAYTTETNVATIKIRGGTEGKQIARETIALWKSGGPAAVLTYNSKVNIIRELLEGGCAVSDQALILDLIEQSEVAHAKRLVDNPEVSGPIRASFSDANKKRFEAIKTGRAAEKNTSSGSFNSDYIKELVDEANSNALDTSSSKNQCIGTVRNISIANLYKHLSAEEQAKIKKSVDKECAGQNRMVDAMTGLHKAGYAGEMASFAFEKKPREVTVNINGKSYKFSPYNFPGALKQSVWQAIDAKTRGQEGWHAFGLSIMTSFHSVTLLVNVRPGGPFLYFIDQVDRHAVEDKYRTASGVGGSMQLTPSSFDSYLAYFAEKSYPDYIQDVINDRKKAGQATTEADVTKHLPSTDIQLWELSTKKKTTSQ